MEAETASDRERRRYARHQLNLPVQTQMNGGDFYDIEMVDISSTGIQIRTREFDVFKGQGYREDHKDRLKISVVARLAWAEPDPKGGLLTGWEFEIENGNQ